MSLPKNTVNEIFSSHFYLNTPNIFDALIRNWTAQLIAKLNTPLCADTTKLAIINNQIKFHSPSAFPDFLQFYNGSTKQFSLIDFLFHYLPKYNLTLDLSNFQVIKGGNTPIMNFLINHPNLKNTITSLRNRRIMFIDQILTPDGLFIRPWKDLQKDNTINCSKGRCPKWFNYILQHFTYYTPSNNSYRLTVNINKPLVSTSFTPHFKIPPLSNRIKNHNNKWVAFWNNSKKEIEYAKIVHSSNKPNSTPTLYTEHFIISYNLTSLSSPARTQHELTRCNQCSLFNLYYISNRHSPSCPLVIHNNKCIKVKVKHLNGKYHTTFYNTDRCNTYNNYIQ